MAGDEFGVDLEEDLDAVAGKRSVRGRGEGEESDTLGGRRCRRGRRCGVMILEQKFLWFSRSRKSVLGRL